jgi:hypothetical protein
LIPSWRKKGIRFSDRQCLKRRRRLDQELPISASAFASLATRRSHRALEPFHTKRFGGYFQKYAVDKLEGLIIFRVFIDSDVLIHAVRGKGDIRECALALLSEPNLEFWYSPFSKLEVVLQPTMRNEKTN